MPNYPMRNWTKHILLTSAVIAILAGIAHAAGIRINTTHSYPPGLYIKTSMPIERGTLVIFCPPDTTAFQEARTRGYIGKGFCPGSYEYMIKKVAAIAGDYIEILPKGVTVNGTLLPKSIPLPADAAGRTLHYFEMSPRILQEEELLLMSDYSVQSFDGRYFGTLDKSVVISAIEPLWGLEK